jgi:hypothetical protein
MAELPPVRVYGVRFDGKANVAGDLSFRGVLRVPQPVIDAVGGMDRLQQYFASAVEDALATTWPFDGPEAEESTPLGERAANDEGSP